MMTIIKEDKLTKKQLKQLEKKKELEELKNNETIEEVKETEEIKETIDFKSRGFKSLKEAKNFTKTKYFIGLQEVEKNEYINWLN